MFVAKSVKYNFDGYHMSFDPVDVEDLVFLVSSVPLTLTLFQPPLK